MASWDVLREPIQIGRLTVKNRIEAAPTIIQRSNADQSVSQHVIEFYRAQAKGGAGLITVMEAAVDEDRAITQPLQLNLGHDRFIPGLTSIVEAIKFYGATASIQLNHGGRQSSSAFIGGRAPIGPTSMTGKFTEDRRRPEVTIEEMTPEMIEKVIANFAAAAWRAKSAGFDMVMVHAGHGWLISQFLSPVANLRTDEYGGSLENRARFGIRVIDAIRDRCDSDFPIELRISASDLVPGGMELEDAIEFAQIMQDRVDCFQVSAGMISEARTYPLTHPSCYLPYGENVERAAAIKRAVNKPVVVVGGIVDLDFAGQVVAEGHADMVAMSRALIADTALVEKTFRGRVEEVVPCIRCNHCLARGAHAMTVLCTTNPWSVQEEYYRCLPPAKSRKKVVVVGGGAAGMEAALVASSRGHDVVLFEREPRLGGNLAVSSAPVFKGDQKRFLTYLLREIDRSDVKVRVATEATPESIKAETPDELILAVGAEPVGLDVPGADRANAVWAADVFTGKEVTGQRVVVAGSGGIGLEAALILAGQGKQVEVVEIPGGSAQDGTVGIVDFRLLLELLEERGIRPRSGWVVDRVDQGMVTLTNDAGRTSMIAMDSLVLATNRRPHAETVEALETCAPRCQIVGDCKAPRILYDAIHDGFEAALEL
jgi:2,4-dienoyl-CoA reductase-like NADH-dependent reductase (Old Yellow Enzyme family)/NADPH-dependent 2,4-dienoyl-CoA reductase/sulfur reductase-like enzyme